MFLMVRVLRSVMWVGMSKIYRQIKWQTHQEVLQILTAIDGYKLHPPERTLDFAVNLHKNKLLPSPRSKATKTSDKTKLEGR